MAHAPSLAEVRQRLFEAHSRDAGFSLYSASGRLHRAVAFGKRDGRDRVTVSRRDLEKTLELAGFAALNIPGGHGPAETRWRRLAGRFTGLT